MNGLRGDRENVCIGVKGKNGELRMDEREVRSRWKKYFEDLLNVEDDRRVVLCELGLEVQGYEWDGWEREGKISLKEVEKAVGKVKMRKAARVDGVTGEMFRHGGQTVSGCQGRIKGGAE